MWKQKISLSIGNRYGFPACEVVKILKQIGFDGIPDMKCAITILRTC